MDLGGLARSSTSPTARSSRWTTRARHLLEHPRRRDVRLDREQAVGRSDRADRPRALREALREASGASKRRRTPLLTPHRAARAAADGSGFPSNDRLGHRRAGHALLPRVPHGHLGQRAASRAPAAAGELERALRPSSGCRRSSTRSSRRSRSAPDDRLIYANRGRARAPGPLPCRAAAPTRAR